MKGDVALGLLQVAAVSGRCLDAASDLLAVQGLTIPMRALDTIHLATAEALHNQSRLTALVAADKRLLAAATARGIPVMDVS